MRFSLLLLTILASFAVTSCKGFSLKRKPKGDKPAAAESEKDRAKREGAESAFLAECARLGASTGAVSGTDGWYFSGEELKRLGAAPAVGDAAFANAVSTISDYRQQLKRSGVAMVVAIVPPKGIIYADHISKEAKVPVKKGTPPRLDSYYRAAAEALKARGMIVLDFTDLFLKNRNAKGGGIYAKGGDTWTPLAAKLAAKEIVDSVKLDTGKAGNVATDTEVSGGNELGGKEEKLALRQILRSDGTPLSIGESGGTVLLLCDGNGTAWRKSNGSLPEQLAYEWQRPVDMLAGPNARNDQRLKIMSRSTTARNPLSASRLVVWCISALDLASNDWRKVPMKLQFKEIQPQLRF